MYNWIYQNIHFHTLVHVFSDTLTYIGTTISTSVGAVTLSYFIFSSDSEQGECRVVLIDNCPLQFILEQKANNSQVYISKRRTPMYFLQPMCTPNSVMERSIRV